MENIITQGVWRGKLETCGGIGRFARIYCFDQTLSAVSVAS